MRRVESRAVARRVLRRSQALVFIVVLFAALLVPGVSAADRCATSGEMATLKIAAFQQQLMVAALTCHKIGAYNHFVRSYRPALVRSDRDMLRLFVRLDGTDGDADYNAYKTRLANLAVLRNNASGGAYCREAREDFAAASSNRRPLAEFVSTRRLSVRLPFEACDGADTTSTQAEVSAPPPTRRHHRHRAHHLPQA